MSRTRPAAVAGLFYPADASQLHRDILSMLESVEVTEKAPKALIVPHAGYIFSGPVAASAFAQLKNNSARIQRVILLGPCHRVPLRGLATSSADFFETPLQVVYTRVMREPSWGLKLTGKEGPHTIGAYVVDDEITNLIIPGSESSDFEVLDQSNLATVLR